MPGCWYAKHGADLHPLPATHALGLWIGTGILDTDRLGVGKRPGANSIMEWPENEHRNLAGCGRRLQLP